MLQLGMGLGLSPWQTTGADPTGNLGDFPKWFLVSGSINLAGAWEDAVSLVGSYFLSADRVNVFGFWDDWQPFSDQSAQAGLFFLASGSTSVVGIWSDAEVFP